jgi:hypothetical protein
MYSSRYKVGSMIRQALTAESSAFITRRAVRQLPVVPGIEMLDVSQRTDNPRELAMALVG